LNIFLGAPLASGAFLLIRTIFKFSPNSDRFGVNPTNPWGTLEIKSIQENHLMLSQMQRLCMEADGRYATDEELRFLPEYRRGYELRFQTYRQLQKLEAIIFQQACKNAIALEPQLFQGSNGEDLTSNCQRDVIYSLRHCAMAMLTDDPELLHERYLLWLQSMLRAVNHQHMASVMFTALQAAVRQHLPESQAALVLPLLVKSQQMMMEGLS
jgi:hypothetical protein